MWRATPSPGRIVHSCPKRWSRLPALAVVLALALMGCSNDSDGSLTASDSEFEVATPRGLAAGVIAHLDPEQIEDVRGNSNDRADTDAVSVAVEMGDEAARLVYVLAVPSGSPYALSSCGSDSGYLPVSCATEPSYREVMRRKRPTDHTPLVMGRHLSDERGSLLIQVWGSGDVAQASAVVEELLDDPLIGIRTTRSMNDSGTAIEDFGTFETEVSDREVRNRKE
jgi:hypothetical protein